MIRNVTRFIPISNIFAASKKCRSLFADMPEALTNTVEIAKRCNVTFTLGKNQLPHFPVPEG